MKLAWFGFLASLLAITSAPAAQVTVPFVGCPADGQTGPEPLPKGTAMAVNVDAQTAARLAYYESVSGGIVAPRGWHCAGLWGSNGWILFVSPNAITPDDFLPPKVGDIKGPIIQASFNLGETSGRQEAAKIMARYFPEKRTFVNEVIGMGFEAASEFPSGSFSGDKFLRRGPRFVEYITPANGKGLGTMSRLAPDETPIYGAAILIDDPDTPSAMTIAVRLPPTLVGLAPVILREAERRYAAEN